MILYSLHNSRNGKTEMQTYKKAPTEIPLAHFYVKIDKLYYLMPSFFLISFGMASLCTTMFMVL